MEPIRGPLCSVSSRGKSVESGAPVRSTRDHCTRQASGMWQWCNGKAMEALAGRRPTCTARWLCLRKLVFVRLPAPVIVRATFSWPIYLLFFVLFLWKLSKKGCHRFFYSFPTISGDETKSGYVEKHLFLYVSKYFGRLTFELWNSVTMFFR